MIATEPVRLATLPVDVEATAYAAAYLSGLPVYVVHDGDQWNVTEHAPDVPCWVFQVPQAA